MLQSCSRAEELEGNWREALWGSLHVLCRRSTGSPEGFYLEALQRSCRGIAGDLFQLRFSKGAVAVLQRFLWRRQCISDKCCRNFEFPEGPAEEPQDSCGGAEGKLKNNSGGHEDDLLKQCKGIVGQLLNN